MWTPTLVGARVPHARPALRIRSDCRTSRAEGGPPGTSAPTTDSDHRFLPKIPTTDPGHRFRPKIPTAVPDRPPVCCVIRPRSRNKSRPSSCVPFRSEIARRHAGGPRLSRPSPRRPRRGASARAERPRQARPSRMTAGRPAPGAGRRGRRPLPQIPTKDSDHRFRPQIPTAVPDRPPCVLRDPATFPQQVATFQLRPVPK